MRDDGRIGLPELINNCYDADGEFIYTSDVARDIAAGRVPGISFIDKFGDSGPNIDTADGLVNVWDGVNDANALKVYTYSDVADIDSISSSSVSDTQQIEVQGLDLNYNVVVQTITLVGQTRVPLTTVLIRVFRLKNVGSVDIAGSVYCYVNGAISGGIPTTPASIKAIIEGSNNQTLSYDSIGQYYAA